MNVNGPCVSCCLPTTRAYGFQFFKVMLFDKRYPPIITVGQPGGIIFPTGLGIGATHAGCAVKSLTLAAGIPPIMTVVEPITTVAGPPGTQAGSVHGVVVLPILAAG